MTDPEVVRPENVPLSEQFREAIAPAREIVQIARVREEGGYTPWVQTVRFPRELEEEFNRLEQTDISSEELTEDLVAEARRLSLAFLLEASIQITEAQPPRQLNEETESLDSLFGIIDQGREFIRQFVRDDADAVLTVARQVMGRHGAVEDVEDHDVQGWVDGTYGRARGRLQRAAESLYRYLQVPIPDLYG